MVVCLDIQLLGIYPIGVCLVEVAYHDLVVLRIRWK